MKHLVFSLLMAVVSPFADAIPALPASYELTELSALHGSTGIMNAATGLCLEQREKGVPTSQWAGLPCSDTSAQHFAFNPDTEMLFSAYDGNCLNHLQFHKLTSMDKVNCDGSDDSQKFYQDANHRIRNRNENNCLEMPTSPPYELFFTTCKDEELLQVFVVPTDPVEMPPPPPPTDPVEMPPPPSSSLPASYEPIDLSALDGSMGIMNAATGTCLQHRDTAGPPIPKYWWSGVPCSDTVHYLIFDSNSETLTSSDDDGSCWTHTGDYSNLGQAIVSEACAIPRGSSLNQRFYQDAKHRIRSRVDNKCLEVCTACKDNWAYQAWFTDCKDDELLQMFVVPVEMPLLPAPTGSSSFSAYDKIYWETVNFWTPSRISQAKPLEMRTFVDPFHNARRSLYVDLNSMKSNSTPATLRSLKAGTIPTHSRNSTHGNRIYDKVASRRWIRDTEDINGGGKMTQAAGRLLLSFGQGAASCSATAIRDYASSDRSLIVTAAHCIYNERMDVFAKYLMFIPNQDDGGDGISDRNCHNDIFGCWVPQFAVVDSEWANNVNDVSHDFGFLVVPNKGAHVGRGGRDVALEDTVQTVDIDWTNKALLEEGDPVYSMGLPGVWSNQLKYAHGSLKLSRRHNLQFNYGCGLTEGSSGGPMPVDPFDNDPMLFSVNSFKSGYFEGGEFIQTACGGPFLHSNSFCALVSVAEATAFDSPEIGSGGIIHPYANSGCVLPGSCSMDTDCDDGLFCTGLEKCVQGFCVTGSDPCGSSRCDEEGDTCLPPCTSDAECQDGIFCNGSEKCQAGKCVAGTEFPCLEGEMCNAVTDTCTKAECVTDSECDDQVFCNGRDICVSGQCKSVPTCEPDEVCDEVSKTCPGATCFLAEDQDFCQDDENNDCCVCTDYCEHSDISVVECAAFLLFPKPQIKGNTTYTPTCLMWNLFQDLPQHHAYKTLSR